MARPGDRMRLKDKIIDNISKAIKSIQELLYYHSNDPVLSGNGDTEGVVLRNGDRPCHKLCENLDHAMLHGLKNVTHGYWRVVRQLSHKGMIKEIDILSNVTTDLGRGRAWLYASLNEGLLESYIRLLVDNEKLLKKYYAKEALVLDADRMNVLLTLTSGLDCATFQLELDLPYLDLNAYPPRSRTDNEMEGDLATSVSKLRSQSTGSYRSITEIYAGSPDSHCRLPSDSDSSSLASVDVQAHSEMMHHMRVSTISADSGYPGEGMLINGIKQRSVTPTDVFVTSKYHVGTPSDTVSLASVGSLGETDRHQRLESIVPASEEAADENGDSLEVIRIRSKRGSNSKSKKKKAIIKSGPSGNKSNEGKPLSKTGKNSRSNSGVNLQQEYGSKDETEAQENSETPQKCPSTPDSLDEVSTIGHRNNSMPQFDSGVDICGLAASGDKTPLAGSQGQSDSVPNTHKASEPNLDRLSLDATGTPPNPMSSLAQIESKIADLCSVDASRSNSSHKIVPSGDGEGSVDTPHSELNSNEIKHSHHHSEVVGMSNSASDQRCVRDSVYNNSSSRQDRLSEQSTRKPTHLGDSSLNSDLSQKKEKHTPEREQSDNSSWTIYDGDQPDNNASTRMTAAEKRENESASEQDEFDFYSNHNSKIDKEEPANKSKKSSQVSSNIAKAQAASKLQDYVDYILQSPDSPPTSPTTNRQESHEGMEEADLSLSLDNNAKLQVMLDIFQHEDEKFIKIFVTRENHTEGESGVVFVLISSYCLYLLHYQNSTKKFVLQTSAKLVDLIFISTGLNDQTMNIESRGKNKQKQRLWITSGHQALTQAILACLTEAVKAVNDPVTAVKSRFSVGSEVPLQKIALRKYISKELNCEAQDVSICDYSLVFWEDPSSVNHHPVDAAYKEGTVLLRIQDPMKGYVWKPVYVLLKNSMLSVSNNKSDPQPHSYLGLGGDQCIGCRLTSLADRDHCVELVLSQGGSWFLSTATEDEISEWRHVLCLAVSQGMLDNNTLATCIPCCVVLSCERLFLCHEDLHTKFFRTLGRAQLEDVTGIAVDEQDLSYCIIEFESQDPGVSSVKWVFYFSSPQDLDRLKMAVGEAWEEIYKVELPTNTIDNVGLQRECQAHSQLLRKQLTLR